MSSVDASGSEYGAPGDSDEGNAPSASTPASCSTQATASSMTRTYFESWDAFFEYLAEYQDSTHQVFRKRTSTSAEARNKELKKRGTLTPATYVPLLFERYYLRLICTHGWTRASRSTGKRDNLFSKSTNCKAHLSLAVVWVDDLGFRVKLTDQSTLHNHRLGRLTYDNHPANRRIEDPDVIDFVDELQAAGAKKKLIMQCLRRRTGKQVTLRD
ncbi:hypothetical protein PF008_g18085 [Phytophthora fragariae]|uniref:FAR1 domain-containing protein n=1 Tax=Phytophthora fragariae TaxID=53985 RepID=A0A6G0R7H7_9STRA|nr:hypothetical protein PF008_g18085 [Phytophthora fragariae]